MKLYKIFSIALFVLGNLVGSGFLVIPSSLSVLGFSSIFSWSICLFITLIYTLIFGELFEIYPKATTVSQYFNFNSKLEKIIAFLYIFCCLIGNTGILIIILNILKITNLFLIFFIILVLSLLNDYINESKIESIFNIINILKFFVIIALPLILFLYDPSLIKIPSFNNDFGLIFKLGIFSFWCFLGIESVMAVGQGKEAKYGLILGVLISGVLYTLISLFIISVIPHEILSNSQMPFLTLINIYNLPILYNYIYFFILFMLFSSLYSWIATISKFFLYYAENKILNEMFLIKTYSNYSKLGLYLSSFLMFLIICLINYLNIYNQFDFIANICCTASLILYSCCGMVLFKENLYRKILSISGVLATLICFIF